MLYFLLYSSIINTIFGSEIAKEGAGRPITQNFTKYTPDNQPVVLFDSKGLEAGMQFEEFLQATLEFFKANEKDIGSNHLPKHFRDNPQGLEKKVHLVWYVVNGAAARFQDFEERICRELFGRLPIIFILNKSDISSQEQRDSLRKVIEDMELPHCFGITETVTSKYEKPEPIKICPNCKTSDDLVIMNRTKKVLCQSCGVETPFQNPTGLTNLLE